MRSTAVAVPADTADVCVVIPTRGRPELVIRAVTSALTQRFPPAEVLVVIDGPDEATEAALSRVDDARVRVLPLPTSHGAAGARNAGVRATDREWIAFLDDDDEWCPEKLAQQFEHVRRNPSSNSVVYATAVQWRTDDFTFCYPKRAPRAGERVADYLFVRSQPGEGMLAVPTLLLRRELALAHPIPEHLRTHEEYDWFLDLERHGCTFSVALEPLTVVHAPSVRASVSTTAGWQSSLAWALARRADLGERAFGAFCLTDVARSAQHTGGLRLFVAIAGMAATARPSGRDLARFLAIWFLPQRLRWRLTNRRRRVG